MKDLSRVRDRLALPKQAIAAAAAVVAAATAPQTHSMPWAAWTAAAAAAVVGAPPQHSPVDAQQPPSAAKVRLLPPPHQAPPPLEAKYSGCCSHRIGAAPSMDGCIPNHARGRTPSSPQSDRAARGGSLQRWHALSK